MRHFDEAFARLAADALRGRVGRDEIGMLLLDLLQPVHQRVVLRVSQLRRIEYVVEMLVVTKLIAQLLKLLVGRKGGRHSEDYKEARSIERLESRSDPASSRLGRGNQVEIIEATENISLRLKVFDRQCSESRSRDRLRTIEQPA